MSPPWSVQVIGTQRVVEGHHPSARDGHEAVVVGPDPAEAVLRSWRAAAARRAGRRHRWRPRCLRRQRGASTAGRRWYGTGRTGPRRSGRRRGRRRPRGCGRCAAPTTAVCRWRRPARSVPRSRRDRGSGGPRRSPGRRVRGSRCPGRVQRSAPSETRRASNRGSKPSASLVLAVAHDHQPADHERLSGAAPVVLVPCRGPGRGVEHVHSVTTCRCRARNHQPPLGGDHAAPPVQFGALPQLPTCSRVEGDQPHRRVGLRGALGDHRRRPECRRRRSRWRAIPVT